MYGHVPRHFLEVLDLEVPLILVVFLCIFLGFYNRDRLFIWLSLNLEPR